MCRVRVSEVINASPEVVMNAVSNIDGLPDFDPDVLKIEWLVGDRPRVGARFVETRVIRGDKTMLNELEITEMDARKIRMVADTHGTVWDSLFEVRALDDERTELSITMDARAHKLMPKLMNPVMKPMFKRGIARHLQKVKARLE